MIEIKARSDKIEISGHAGYAECGKDIVCAGVSVLTRTLIDSIASLTEDEIEVEIHDGYVCIKFKDLSEQSKLMVDSFFIGICFIYQEYGCKYIELV